MFQSSTAEIPSSLGEPMAAALPELLASARQQVTMQEDVRRLSQQVGELTRLVRTLHGVPNNTDVDGLRPAPEGTGEAADALQPRAPCTEAWPTRPAAGAYGDADNGMLASAPVLYHQAGALGASQVSALGPQVATKAPSHRASHSAVKGETAKRVQSAMKFAVKHQTQEIFGSTYSSGLQQQATSNNKSEYERAQQRKYRLIIYPISTFRLSWDMVAAMLICFVAVVLPYRVAFVDSWSRTWAVVDFLVDVFFICDFALNFCTAYIGPTGILERRHHKIALHYLRTWFGATQRGGATRPARCRPALSPGPLARLSRPALSRPPPHHLARSRSLVCPASFTRANPVHAPIYPLHVGCSPNPR